MPAAVREVQNSAYGSGSPQITFTAVPNPTDIIVVTCVAVTSMTAPTALPSGLGATWELAYNHPNGYVTFWIGRNPTAAAGTVNCAVGGGRTGTNVRFVGYLVSGVQNSSVFAAAATSGTGTELLGPVQSGRDGKLLVAAGMPGSSLVLSGVQPSAGAWTRTDVGTTGTSEWGYAVPSESVDTNYQAKITASGSTNLSMAAIVIGSSPPEVPTALVKTGSSRTTLSMDWGAPASGPTPTSYQYRVDGGGAVDVGTATQALISGLETDTSYQIQVRSVYQGLYSAWSAITVASTSDIVALETTNRLMWNAPEARFFDAGLDRGVLYPRKPEPPGPIVETNLVTNPSFEVDKTGWTDYSLGTVGAFTVTPTTHVDASSGDKYALVSGSDLNSGVNDRVGLSSAQITIPGGAMVSVGATFGGTLPADRRFLLVAQFVGASGDLAAVDSASFLATGEKTYVFQAPADAIGVRLRCVMAGTLASSASPVAFNFWVDSVWLQVGLDVAYFDGDTETDSRYTYEWSGTAHNSTSYKRERFGTAVAWNGLISVDEEGGDGAATYYIDGRPFLFLPRPKEYKATLSAYTYPDEFSEIMGVVEATDGMYLDSQPGAAFDLSYRTKVGNGLDGIDHGYKIHLVYNATVTPQALSYSSISDTINPTTFSWEIQAVPTKVEGFRPTAHIIIDTRHMDAARISAIETMMYGDDSQFASMPSPQQIFDLLSFGDAIVVTDNGDGTFDVTGSYENVYMIDVGVFRVDNIDGIDNGDGTFTISSTNL